LGGPITTCKALYTIEGQKRKGDLSSTHYPVPIPAKQESKHKEQYECNYKERQPSIRAFACKHLHPPDYQMSPLHMTIITPINKNTATIKMAIRL
jgi:uncharacterized protein (DUF2249 family)